MSYSLFYVSDHVMGTSKESITFYIRSFTYMTHVDWMTINCLLFVTFLNLLYIRIYKLANGESITFYFRSFTYMTHIAWMTINCLLFVTFLNLLYIRIYKLANGEVAVGKLNI
jgi:hypothetical protein